MANYEHLRRLLQAMNFSEIVNDQLLLEQTRILSVNTREVLFRFNDPVNFIYLILSGSFSLQAPFLEKADSIIYAFKRPRHFLGIFAYLDHSLRHNATAISMETSTVLEIPRSVFGAAIQQNKDLLKEVHSQLAANFKELQKDRELQRAPVSVRLANLLLYTLKSQNQENCRSIMMRITKTSLSKKIGAEPETVIRLIGEWTRQGIIKTEGKTFEISDRGELQRIASSWIS